MRASRWIVAAAIAGVSSLVTLIACHGSSQTAGATEEGGIPAVVLADGSWGSSECAACTLNACAAQRTDCQADPGCAANLDCIEACPLTADGDPDAACVKACPMPSASATEQARIAFEQCRTLGAATACASCAAAQRRRYQDPLLTSFCADGTYDASPSDTPLVTACSTCGATKCCASHRAYVADPGAVALRDCVKVCGDPACERACDAEHDSSLATFWGFVVCDSVMCQNECQFPATDCAACTNMNCADELAACRGNHDCDLLWDCFGACGTEDCKAACSAKYPSGATAFADFVLCDGQRCPSCH